MRAAARSNCQRANGEFVAYELVDGGHVPCRVVDDSRQLSKMSQDMLPVCVCDKQDCECYLVKVHLQRQCAKLTPAC